MRTTRALAIYLAVVFLGGALLAPGLYSVAQDLGTDFPAWRKLAAQPFSRYLSRSFMALALLGLWPLFRALGANSLAEVGVVRPAGQMLNLLGGLLIGFCSLASLVFLGMVLGPREWHTNHSTLEIMGHFCNASLSAVVVGVLEEVLFRGAIFGALKRTAGVAAAFLLSSGIYAMTHFFAPVRLVGEVHWHSGLAALPQMAAGFLDVEKVCPGFFNLMLAGMILALLYHRTGALYASIGLHAGWIFCLKTAGFFTQFDSPANFRIWGTHRLIDGWLALPLLAAVLLAALRLFPKPDPQSKQ